MSGPALRSAPPPGPRGWFGEVRYTPGWTVRRFATEADAEAWTAGLMAIDPAALAARTRPMPERTRCAPPQSTPVELRPVR